MSNFNAKQSLTQDRQLVVQRLVLPITVVGNATPASVVLSSDAPALIALQSNGVNQITAALAASETATFTTATPTDASGQLNVLVRVGEPVVKIMSVSLADLGTGFTALTGVAAKLGSATGITTGTGGGNSIMLEVVTGGDHSTATTFQRAVIVEYITRK